MLIANPIYDVVFKYLMEDSKVAKLLISSIIGRDIELIDFSPKEFTTELPEQKRVNVKTLIDQGRANEIPFFTIYKLDFLARIKSGEEEKIVLIEVQKSKLADDIMRFRRYLGEQYRNSENVYEVIINGRNVVKACEIISIYFLGHKLDNITGVPVIKSPKTYIDVSNGNEINEKEYFLDSLNHESYTVVIPELKERRRNELEILLSIFDQSNRTDDNHILNVKEEDFPEEYRNLIRRLQKAASENEVRNTMNAEDDILRVLKEKEELIVFGELAIAEKEEEIRKKAIEIEESKKLIVEKDKVIENKDKVIENKDKVIEDKDKVIEDKDKVIEDTKMEIERQKREIEELKGKLKDSFDSD